MLRLRLSMTTLKAELGSPSQVPGALVSEVCQRDVTRAALGFQKDGDVRRADTSGYVAGHDRSQLHQIASREAAVGDHLPQGHRRQALALRHALAARIDRFHLQLPAG